MVVATPFLEPILILFIHFKNLRSYQECDPKDSKSGLETRRIFWHGECPSSACASFWAPDMGVDSRNIETIHSVAPIPLTRTVRST
jgi:hypothetical protein